MAILNLPVRSDVESYNFSAVLEGTTYLFRFRFNRRAGRWFMDIATSDGVDLVCGIVIQTNVNLIGRFEIDGMPPGLMLAYDESGQAADAGILDLGVTVKLTYQESTG
jgi:hypothetical protein